MRISNLTLKNYRCFEKFDLALPCNFTILVGNNGSGKSTVLDGLAVGLASFFLGMEGASSGSIHKSDVRIESFELGSRIERQTQYPSRIEYIVDDYMKSKDNLKEILNAYALQNPEIDINIITPDEKYIKEFLHWYDGK